MKVYGWVSVKVGMEWKQARHKIIVPIVRRVETVVDSGIYLSYGGSQWDRGGDGDEYVQICQNKY